MAAFIFLECADLVGLNLHTYHLPCEKRKLMILISEGEQRQNYKAQQFYTYSLFTHIFKSSFLALLPPIFHPTDSGNMERLTTKTLLLLCLYYLCGR